MALVDRSADIMHLLESLQQIAREGLHYARDPYDIARYERLMQLAVAQYTTLLDVPSADVRSRLAAEIGSITPKVGADAAIFSADGEILLMDRADGSGWCLPCGWVETDERPIDATIREVREETGLEVAVRQLVGIFTRFPNVLWGAHTMVACVHLCEVVGGELRLSHEGRALRYWPVDAALNWHGIHQKYARAAYQVWQSSTTLPPVSD